MTLQHAWTIFCGLLVGWFWVKNRQLSAENCGLQEDHGREKAGRDWEQQQYVSEMARYGVPPSEAIRRINRQ